MKYAVIGSGAIGCYYGSKLAKAGNEVHFLFHSDYEYVKKNGLQINSYLGDFHLDNVLAYNKTTDMPQVDVVIVGLKTVNNHLLPTLLPPLLTKDTIVLLIQNGVGVEQDVQQMFPDTQLAAGLAFIASSKTEPGVVNHVFFGGINIGNYSVKDEQRYSDMLREFELAEISVNNVEYNEARWRKAVWNMPFNGMTVANNSLTNNLLDNPETKDLIYRQMLEVIHAAWACGVTAIKEDFADTMMQSTLEMVPYAPSMKLDYDFGRKMEIKYLYSRPIEIAKEHGFDMVLMKELEAKLKALS